MNLDFTLSFIKIAHEGQVDKAGIPFYTHPVRVMDKLPKDATEAEKHAALLHDVVEDTEITLDDLSLLGYSDEITTIVGLVTRDKTDGKTYQEWIESIVASGNKSAIRIKIADNTDNMSEDRLVYLPVVTQLRFKQKYIKSRKMLEIALKPE